VRWGWHLVTNCQRANQGKKSHKDVESILIHYFNTYTHITATKAKPFANTNMQADILLSGITTIDNPDGKDVHIDVTSTNPMGTSNQDLMNRYRPARQPDPSEHDGRNNTLVSAVWAESKKHAKYDNLCAAAGTTFSPFALETMVPMAHRRKRSTTSSPSTYATLVCPWGRHSVTEAQAQEGHLVCPAPGNDCSGYHPPSSRQTSDEPAQRAAEAELAVNEVGLAW